MEIITVSSFASVLLTASLYVIRFDPDADLGLKSSAQLPLPKEESAEMKPPLKEVYALEQI